jgi:hypothetical protein
MENQNQASTVGKETGNPQQIVSPELVEITLQLKRINDYFLAYRERTDSSKEWVFRSLSGIENSLMEALLHIGDIAKDEFMENIFYKD